MLTPETAKRQIQQAAMTAAYQRGASFTYADVSALLTPELREVPRFVCEQAELAGFPVWTSAPNEAWLPY
jgi:hypothetical protein